jgi:hypothetical protein
MSNKLSLSFCHLFCEHAISLPQVITGPGQYRTRGGEVVTVMGFSGHRDFWAHGSYSNGVKESWMPSGRVLPGYLSQNDIVGVA